MRGLCLSERIQDVIISAMQKFINSAILQEVALECLAALSAAGTQSRILITSIGESQ